MLTPELEGLYAITDESLIAEEHFGISVEQALMGGAHMLQYRDKSQDRAKRLHQAQIARQLCYEYNALLIINDDIDLASHCNADGVHLGQDDASIEQARRMMGSDSIVGITCHNQLELAFKADHEGADYIAFGAFYGSPTKPGAVTAEPSLLTQAKAQFDIPVCAIGGITSDNAQPLIDAGADMIAVISGIFDSEDITRSARRLADLF